MIIVTQKHDTRTFLSSSCHEGKRHQFISNTILPLLVSRTSYDMSQSPPIIILTRHDLNKLTFYYIYIYIIV